ncbi:MAG: AAA family ATPase [Acidobacteriota bacterium]
MSLMTRFTVSHFRQFEKPTSVQLDPITVLIGANNSGKTAILQALTLYQYCVEKCLTRSSKTAPPSQWQLKKTENVPPDQFGPLPVATPTDLWPQGKPKQAITLTGEFEGSGTITFEIKLQYNLFNIRPTVAGNLDIDSLFTTFAIRLIPVFSGLLPREEYLVLPARQERQQAQRYGEIVRNLLFSLKKEAPQRYQLLTKLLLRLYPDVVLDVNYDEEVARRIASARIDSTYHDSLLARDLDLIVAGSGLHQAVQILAGMLQPGVSMVLLDEPDAHFHARLQSGLMRILTELVEPEKLQFVIATHSPQLLRAAPSGSLRVCKQGALVPFAPGPDQLELLDHLGALERMELVPLLQSRRVVFVENRDDRHLIELWMRKRLQAKADAVLNRLTFLYTYQEPVSTRVLEKARQVNDLLKSKDLEPLGAPSSVAFLAVGDRDYRSDQDLKTEERVHARKSKQPPFGFDFSLYLWRRAEIENYLLDVDAMCRAVQKVCAESGKRTAWKRIEASFRELVATEMSNQKDAVLERYAARIQDRDRRLNLTSAMQQARAALTTSWGDGSAWCDAKNVLSAARRFLQEQGLPAQALSHKKIIEAVVSMPQDVETLIKKLTKLSRPTKKAVSDVVRAHSVTTEAP